MASDLDRQRCIMPGFLVQDGVAYPYTPHPRTGVAGDVPGLCRPCAGPSRLLESALDGEPEGILGAVAWTATRGAIVAGVMYMLGQRAHVLRNALVASAAIEVLQLVWTAFDRQNREAELGPATNI